MLGQDPEAVPLYEVELVVLSASTLLSFATTSYSASHSSG